MENTCSSMTREPYVMWKSLVLVGDVKALLSRYMQKYLFVIFHIRANTQSNGEKLLS